MESYAQLTAIEDAASTLQLLLMLICGVFGLTGVVVFFASICVMGMEYVKRYKWCFLTLLAVLILLIVTSSVCEWFESYCKALIKVKYPQYITTNVQHVNKSENKNNENKRSHKN